MTDYSAGYQAHPSLKLPVSRNLCRCRSFEEAADHHGVDYAKYKQKILRNLAINFTMFKNMVILFIFPFSIIILFAF